jgi:TetR/AcrR family transcriptional regulator, cholesterol catabolism regulator
MTALDVTAADLRRQEIVSKAAALFDEVGYANTSMDAIARATEMAKPTLYHYFKSKDEILSSIHEEFIDLLIAEHEAHLVEGLTPSQAIFEHIADILSLMDTHHGHVRVFFEHFRELPVSRRAEIDEKRSAYFEFVGRMVRDGIASGEFRDLNPTITTMAIFGMANWTYQWYDPSGSLASRTIAEHFWDLLHHGMVSGEVIS